MRITLDSTEPLEDALRVVGAMYNVELAVSPDRQGRSARAGAAVADKTSAKRASIRKGPSAEKPRSPATRADRAARGSRRRPVPSSNGSLGNAEIRSWAKQNGLTVKDRGRLPAAIITAYQSANLK